MYEYPYHQQYPVAPRKRSALKSAALFAAAAVLMLGSGFFGAAIAVARLEGEFELAREGQRTAGSLPWRPDAEAAELEPTLALRPSAHDYSLPEIFDGANPAVVAISTETVGRNVFGREVVFPASGSGFLVSPGGYIVTNEHVIENASRITVFMYDGRQYEAEVVGSSAFSDLAVLKIEGEGLPHLRFGDSDLNRVGEQVAAIGNPLGELANSMTVGYISSLERDVQIDRTPHVMLQTDAAINRGNSGGPLLNLRGEVIGVISAKRVGSGVEGLGFAIPSNYAARIVEQIIEYGLVRRAVIGVTVDEVDGAVKLIAVSPGGPAQIAGLEPGDAILRIGERQVANFLHFRLALNSLTPGEAVEILVSRNGVEMAFEVVTGEAH